MGVFDRMRVCPKCRRAVKTGLSGKCPICHKDAIYPDNVADLSMVRTMSEWAAMSESAKQDFVKFCLESPEGPDNKETKVKCNTCGHLFCYNTDDIRRNRKNVKDAKSAAHRGLAMALSGSVVGHYAETDAMERALDKVVDYSCCPKCNSRDIRILSDDEYEQETKINHLSSSKTQNITATEEIKRFKELFDMGIISQEEFDAKKKQLLGL